MKVYYAIMHSIFAYKVGPLAIETKEYIAALMRTKSMLREAQAMMDIEVLPMSYYKYTVEDDGQWLQMLRTNGEKIRVARDEMTLDDMELRQHDGCCAIFVKYLGTWHLNGIIIPVKDIASHWDDFVNVICKFLPNYFQKNCNKQISAITCSIFLFVSLVAC